MPAVGSICYICNQAPSQKIDTFDLMATSSFFVATLCIDSWQRRNDVNDVSDNDILQAYINYFP